MKYVYRILNASVNPETLARHRQTKMILESASTQKMKGRYSIVAFDKSGELKLTEHALEVTLGADTTTITHQPFEALKEKVAMYQHDIHDEALQPLPFVSGFIGAFSFDVVRHAFPVLKETPIEENGTDVHLYMVESAYIFDHYKEQIYVITTNLFSGIDETKLNERLQKMITEFENVQLFDFDEPSNALPREIETSEADDQFLQQVSYFKSLTQQGDVFQIVPSRIYRYRHHFGDKRAAYSYRLYQNLKRKNPSPYMFYMNMDDQILVGSSPESFVKVEGDTVMTNPIAGTARRGQTYEEDQQLEQELLKDEKEISEHSMLVDLGRNDILRIAQPGSLEIPKLMLIERYEHVMHIVSEVTGKINPSLSVIDIIASLLPTGTVSGAPKLRAIQRIYEQKPVKRGVYSGGVGYINCNGDLDLALAIRTMVIDDTYVNVEAGCGVVYDSVPEKELKETRLKAQSLLEVSL
ncbi:anthranilate synthase component I [Staphylococcus canis]|uniref:Anthranilate synthase component 1 n=1 Tax=Staphylococcus canis TaxID=2724942 RepID=A0ABS0T6L2_9STAP|nr:anthranilate synthase component I [Staphylococcus canis]MBI5974384.1 anthranilate synthase component I [Staphylococcus canis]